MIVLSFKVNQSHFKIKTEKGEDLLYALDKFLKKNKINKAVIKNWQLDFLKEKSMTSQY